MNLTLIIYLAPLQPDIAGRQVKGVQRIRGVRGEVCGQDVARAVAVDQ